MLLLAVLKSVLSDLGAASGKEGVYVKALFLLVLSAAMAAILAFANIQEQEAILLLEQLLRTTILYPGLPG